MKQANCPNPIHKNRYKLKPGNVEGYFECGKCDNVYYIAVATRWVSYP